jgi:hypothetical protein
LTLKFLFYSDFFFCFEFLKFFVEIKVRSWNINYNNSTLDMYIREKKTMNRNKNTKFMVEKKKHFFLFSQDFIRGDKKNKNEN